VSIRVKERVLKRSAFFVRRLNQRENPSLEQLTPNILPLLTLAQPLEGWMPNISIRSPLDEANSGNEVRLNGSAPPKMFGMYRKRRNNALGDKAAPAG